MALADLPGAPSGGEATTAKTWRTVLHFDPDAPPLAGAPAIARYVQNEGQGRLIQSIKSPTRAAFGKWITPELDDIDAVVGDVLSRAGVTAADVDTVFATAVPPWFRPFGGGWRPGSARRSWPAERSSPPWRGVWRRGRGSCLEVREEAVAGQRAQRVAQGRGWQQLSRRVAPALGFAHERGELDEGTITPLDEDAGVKEDFVRSGRVDREAHVPLRAMGSRQLPRELRGGTAPIGMTGRQRLDQIGPEPEGEGGVTRAHQRLGTRRHRLSPVQRPATDVVAKPRMTGAVARISSWLHPRGSYSMSGSGFRQRSDRD